MASHVADVHELAAEDSLGVISIEEFREAQRDPQVIALLRRARRRLAERTAARERRDDAG